MYRYSLTFNTDLKQYNTRYINASLVHTLVSLFPKAGLQNTWHNTMQHSHFREISCDVWNRLIKGYIQ